MIWRSKTTWGMPVTKATLSTYAKDGMVRIKLRRADITMCEVEFSPEQVIDKLIPRLQKAVVTANEQRETNEQRTTGTDTDHSKDPVGV
jgi:hypothetical protein